MENLTLKLDGTTPEIIWREGVAPKIVDPLAVSIEGDIRTVGTFVRGRSVTNLQGINAETTIVQVNVEAGTISLETNPNDVYGTKVKGTLAPSDELAQFCINGGKMFSQKELIKLLKFSRNHFADPLVHADLLKQYTAFSFNTTTDGHASSDDRGNKSAAVKKTVATNLPTEFTLKIPIFKGEDSKVFRVELCLDVTGGGAKFWLESIELHEIQQIEKEIIFKRELEFCEGLVVIFK
jgi:hypothetical protein